MRWNCKNNISSIHQINEDKLVYFDYYLNNQNLGIITFSKVCINSEFVHLCGLLF